MPTEEQIRRLNIEADEAAQLERFRSADSFQPARRPPPVPIGFEKQDNQEEVSRFSDSDDEDHTFTRALSFARGASKRYVKHSTTSLTCVREMLSDEFLNQAGKDAETGQHNQTLPRSVSAAASRALASAESRNPRPFPASRQPSQELENNMTPVSKRQYEGLKRRGLIPVWKLMDDNREISRQGSFLKGGTLRKPKSDKRGPQRSNNVADPETIRSKRGGTVFYG